LPFFEGKQEKSNRDSFIYFAPSNKVRAVKWGDWKLHYVWQDEPGQPVQQTMKLFNLRSDPKEETDIKDFNPWVVSAIGRIVKDFWTTVDKYPLIPVGTPDPYTPPSRAVRSMNLRVLKTPPAQGHRCARAAARGPREARFQYRRSGRCRAPDGCVRDDSGRGTR
jgi:hypothetical protein